MHQAMQDSHLVYSYSKTKTVHFDVVRPPPPVAFAVTISGATKPGDPSKVWLKGEICIWFMLNTITHMQARGGIRRLCKAEVGELDFYVISECDENVLRTWRVG